MHQQLYLQSKQKYYKLKFNTHSDTVTSPVIYKKEFYGGSVRQLIVPEKDAPASIKFNLDCKYSIINEQTSSLKLEGLIIDNDISTCNILCSEIYNDLDGYEDVSLHKSIEMVEEEDLENFDFTIIIKDNKCIFTEFETINLTLKDILDKDAKINDTVKLFNSVIVMLMRKIKLNIKKTWEYKDSFDNKSCLLEFKGNYNDHTVNFEIQSYNDNYPYELEDEDKYIDLLSIHNNIYFPQTCIKKDKQIQFLLKYYFTDHNF